MAESKINNNNMVEVETGITNVKAYKKGNLVLLNINGIDGTTSALPTILRPKSTKIGVGVNSTDLAYSRIIVYADGKIQIPKNATIFGEVIYTV